RGHNVRRVTRELAHAHEEPRRIDLTEVGIVHLGDLALLDVSKKLVCLCLDPALVLRLKQTICHLGEVLRLLALPPDRREREHLHVLVARRAAEQILYTEPVLVLRAAIDEEVALAERPVALPEARPCEASIDERGLREELMCTLTDRSAGKCNPRALIEDLTLVAER